MANFTWVIDQRKCIGCHACTTACKSENEVPLSVDRTWVKYVEKGNYPNTQRHFGVLRCNHCANPPCVHICPTTAMFQRPDGIVEFDKDACIGCKACIAACPYDAIYIDPESHTAAKCNFCAHRLDVGLEPACVVVCPEEALIFGDLDDPLSKVNQLIGREKTQVRKPEKNTDPKCFYIGADEAVLNPDVQTHDESGLYMWSNQREEKHGAHLDNNIPSGISLSSALNTVTGAKVAYDVHHDIPWAQYVSLYLWTKSISSGAFVFAWMLWSSIQFGFIPGPMPLWLVWGAPAISMVYLGITGVLLIADLDRPERFWYIIARPQWKSWLAIGSYIILVYSALLMAILGAFLLGFGMQVSPWLYHITMPLAVMTAIYTAFLFAQAKARDMWQSPALPLHLLQQAVLAGACVSIPAAALMGNLDIIADFARPTIVASLVLHLILTIGGEVMTEHSSKAKQRAVDVMVKGPYSKIFWWGNIVFGSAVPLILLLVTGFAAPSFSVDMLVAFLGLFGLLAYEHCFVMAGQSVRLS